MKGKNSSDLEFNIRQTLTWSMRRPVGKPLNQKLGIAGVQLKLMNNIITFQKMLMSQTKRSNRLKV